MNRRMFLLGTSAVPIAALPRPMASGGIVRARPGGYLVGEKPSEQFAPPGYSIRASHGPVNVTISYRGQVREVVACRDWTPLVWGKA